MKSAIGGSDDDMRAHSSRGFLLIERKTAKYLKQIEKAQIEVLQ